MRQERGKHPAFTSSLRLSACRRGRGVNSAPEKGDLSSFRFRRRRKEEGEGSEPGEGGSMSSQFFREEGEEEELASKRGSILSSLHSLKKKGKGERREKRGEGGMQSRRYPIP